MSISIKHTSFSSFKVPTSQPSSKTKTEQLKKNFTLQSGAPSSMKWAKKTYFMSPSVKVLNGLKNPKETIRAHLGDRALDQLVKMPSTVRAGIATEHAIRNRGLYYMVQSTPKCMAFLNEVLTMMQNDKGSQNPYLQLRHEPKEGTVDGIIKAMKASGANDLSPEFRGLLLSGTFGLFHSVVKDESPLSYLVENRACTSKETLRKIAITVFTGACIHQGYSDAKRENLTRKFTNLFDKHLELDFPTLLYVNFKPEDADNVGYHALPFGQPHPEPKLSEVMPQAMENPSGCKVHFCSQNATKQQMRLAAVKSVLTSNRIGVVNTSNENHLKQIGAISTMAQHPLPARVEELIGKEKISDAEKKEKESHQLLQKEIQSFEEKLKNNL